MPPKPAGYDDRARADADGRVTLGRLLAVLLESMSAKLPAGPGSPSKPETLATSRTR